MTPLADDATNCPMCGTRLESVFGGWCWKSYENPESGVRAAFYGQFRHYENLRGIFSWIETEEDIAAANGMFCRYGHIGLSTIGRITWKEFVVPPSGGYVSDSEVRNVEST